MAKADRVEIPVDLKFNPSITELVGLMRELRNYSFTRQALNELWIASAPGYVRPNDKALTLEQAREMARLAILER